MSTSDLPKLPRELSVQVRKGESGILLADLPELYLFTEAEDLNELFFTVNDLIITYFNIPKKFQNKINYSPTKEAQEFLLEIVNSKPQDNSQKFELRSFYTPDLARCL